MATTSEHRIEAKCIFGHKFNVTAEQIKKLHEFGCVFCQKCGNAATVTKITVKKGKAK